MASTLDDARERSQFFDYESITVLGSPLDARIKERIQESPFFQIIVQNLIESDLPKEFVARLLTTEDGGEELEDRVYDLMKRVPGYSDLSPEKRAEAISRGLRAPKEIIEELSRIATLSKTVPTSEINRSSLKEIFSPDLSDCDLIDRLKLLSLYFYPGALEKARDVLTHFFKKYPEVMKQYFNESLILNFKGIAWNVAQIAKKKGVKFPVYLFTEGNIQAFALSQNLRAGFVWYAGGHYTPIYVEKTPGKPGYDLIISDSLGPEDVRMILGAGFKEIQINSIYNNQSERQKDWVSCASFTIRDFSKWITILQSGKNPIAEMGNIACERDLSDPLREVYKSAHLPDKLMKSTQSSTTIGAERHRFQHHREPGRFINCLAERYHLKCMWATMEALLAKK